MEGKLTSPTVLREVLSRHGVRLRPELGQHFLADGNILERIVELTEAGGDETAVEVGAGAGTLTVALAPRVRELVAVEVDRRLISVLEETTAAHPNVRVLPGISAGSRSARSGNGSSSWGTSPTGSQAMSS